MDNRTNIGGREVAVGFMSATEALKVFLAIVKICGEPIFKTVMNNKATQQEIGGAVIGLMAANLESEAVLNAMQTVFKYVSIEGARVTTIDDAFSGGRTLQMLKVFIFALKVNYADFLDGELFASLKSMRQTPSPSPT